MHLQIVPYTNDCSQTHTNVYTYIKVRFHVASQAATPATYKLDTESREPCDLESQGPDVASRA